MSIVVKMFLIVLKKRTLFNKIRQYNIQMFYKLSFLSTGQDKKKLLILPKMVLD